MCFGGLSSSALTARLPFLIQCPSADTLLTAAGELLRWALAHPGKLKRLEFLSKPRFSRIGCVWGTQPDSFDPGWQEVLDFSAVVRVGLQALGVLLGVGGAYRWVRGGKWIWKSAGWKLEGLEKSFPQLLVAVGFG